MQDEIFEAMIQSQVDEQQTKVEAEMVPTETIDTPPAEQHVETPTEQPIAEMATEVPAEQPTETPTPEAVQTVDYNEWLKTESGGLFQDTESFKKSLDKFKDYDAKSAKVEELEKNQLPDDAFLKTLATMRQSGATKDQITEFVKLNTEVEDFSTLTPEQLKIAKLVLVDGYSKDTATRKVQREFDLSEYVEGSDEYNDLKEELRISSQKQDLPALESYKAKISTIENKAEQQKLEQIALKSAHLDNVKQTIPTILDKFTGIGAVDLVGTIGKEEVNSNLNFDFDDDFKKAIPGMLETYFNSEIAPITEHSLQEAGNYIKATYLANNWEKILSDVYKTALAVAHEKTDNKFVNPNTPKEVTKDSPQKDAALTAEWKAFEDKVANWR